MTDTDRQTRQRRSAADTREHILRVAHDLFYGGGLHATGVDKVADAAQVAPTTLYRAFGSKDDLVAAYVHRADLLNREWIEAAIRRAPDDPRSAVLAVFDGLRSHLDPATYRGCVCQMTLAEYADGAPRRAAVAAKEWLHARFAGLLRDGGAGDPGGLAGQLMVIYEGALASAQCLGTAEPAVQARALAELLLDRGL
ncbi:TetR/AcrR family transcriptional regulator [Dactylosporangium darangshiense]|uniref:TetR/AcrR family transcriptional regulator n=1 Tax=Dactylosporangium darangshiense TaxID=579108 RepID=A0ABP8DKW4_9ACTN